MLTPRERVLKTINHENPDRVPIDLGSTGDTSIVKEAYDKLRLYLNLELEKSEFLSMVLRSVKVSEDVQKKLDTDIIGIHPGPIGKTEWLEDNKYIDGWGITRIKPPGNYYYDQFEFPLSGEITKKDIIDYSHWPDPDAPSITNSVKKQLYDLHNNTTYALLASLPACFIHRTQFLRGYEDWYADCLLNPNLLETLFDTVLEINIHIAKRILKIVKDDVDIIMTSDDLGSQQGLQFSPDFFRRKIKPRLKKYFDVIHSEAPKTKLLFHSCGSIEDILDDLIEIGVDIINPVQVSAANMDTAYLKSKYGDRLSFWGAIDTQDVMPHGSINDVRMEVEKRIRELGNNGGYILGAVHNIQPDVDPEKIVAMFNHAKDFSSNWYNTK